MLDPVPWLVSTPGVQHSAEVARTLAYSATNGATGVIGSSSFKVAQQGTPNGSVRVLAGVASAVSNYPGHSGQSYILRNATATTVNVAPTTSAGGRTDAVIARVDDVGLVGQVPANVNSYNYTKLEVIQGVPSSLKYESELNLNYPFVLLAKITLPASTATVTDTLITDLRQVVNAREATVTRAHHLNTGQGTTMTTTAAFPDGQYFPNHDVLPTLVRTIRTPEWATWMEIRVEWFGGNVPANAGAGQCWSTFGFNGSDTGGRIQPTHFTSTDTATRQNWTAADTVPLPATMRGKDIVFAPRARHGSKTNSGVNMDGYSSVILTVRFLERAD